MSKIIQLVKQPVLDISSFSFLSSSLWRAGMRNSLSNRFNRTLYLEKDEISASADFRHSWRLLEMTGPTSTFTGKMNLYFDELKVYENFSFTQLSINQLNYLIQVHERSSISGKFFLRDEIKLNLLFETGDKMVDNLFVLFPEKTQEELKIIEMVLEENEGETQIINEKMVF